MSVIRGVASLDIFLLLWVLGVAVLAVDVTDFITTNFLPDGEEEIHTHYHGLTGKETRVGRTNQQGILLRQLTDGKHFIQLIYDEDEILRDCEFLRERHQVDQFLRTFKSELAGLISSTNITIQPLDGVSRDQLPEAVRKWLDMGHLKGLCHRRHREIRKMSDEQSGGKNTTRWRRRPRAISYLLAPGTLWCGYSDAASTYTDLGGMHHTDKCCRKHDHCPHNIPGFTRRYQYYNIKPFTISQCWCDASFRTCLKMVDTSDANLVGKLFFNVVQTKCFVLKPKKMCVKRSWWGKCTKTKYLKQAILRDNLPY